MKTFAHASQSKFDQIHLAANNGIYNIYKKTKQFHNSAEMVWYHPVVLSFDNHADLSSFILLNEYIQYFNTHNTHLIAKNDLENMIKPTWKNLKDVYKTAQLNETKFIPHNDISVLSHPHYSIKHTVPFTGGDDAAKNEAVAVQNWEQKMDTS